MTDLRRLDIEWTTLIRAVVVVVVVVVVAEEIRGGHPDTIFPFLRSAATDFLAESGGVGGSCLLELTGPFVSAIACRCRSAIWRELRKVAEIGQIGFKG